MNERQKLKKWHNETNETTNYYTLCFDKYDIETQNDNQFDTENCEILGICKNIHKISVYFIFPLPY